MKITLRCAGLIKSGPERELVDDYLKRANGLSRRLGISAVVESAVDIRNQKSRAAETDAILSPDCDILVILDERGKTVTSRQIAKSLAKWRDDGTRNLMIAIGGADGFEPSSLPTNVQKWNFGSQTWPHKLVRIMLAEQIYRGLSILDDRPYHRD